MAMGWSGAKRSALRCIMYLDNLSVRIVGGLRGRCRAVSLFTVHVTNLHIFTLCVFLNDREFRGVPLPEIPIGLVWLPEINWTIVC